MSESGKRVIVVIGMHRSGTSAVTRGLQLLGVDLGESLLPPVPGDNDKGFWEDQEIYRLNEQILARLHTSWHGLAPISARDLLSIDLAEERDAAIEILAARTGAVPLFGFKDPRTSILLPFWQSVFQQLGIDDAYIFAIRNPLSVAESLHRRNGIEREKALCLWVKYTLDAVRYTQDKPTVVVDFDLFLEDPARHLQRIARALQLPPADPDGSDLKEYIESFLSKSLRHSQHNIDIDPLQYRAPGLPRELYSSLMQSADDELAFDGHRKAGVWQQAEEEFGRYPGLFSFVDRAVDAAERAQIEAGEAQKLRALAEKRQQASQEQQEKVNQRYADLSDRHKALLERKDVLKNKIAQQKSVAEVARAERTQQKARKLQALAEKRLQESQAQQERVNQRYADLSERHKGLLARQETLKRKITELQATQKTGLAGLKHGQAPGMKARGKQLLRKAWHSAPLTLADKIRIRNTLFQTLPFLFSGTATYRIWASAKDQVRQSPTVKPATAAVATRAAPPSAALAGAGNHRGEVLITSWMSVEDPMIDGLVALAQELGELGIGATFIGSVELYQRRQWSSCLRHGLLLSEAKYPAVAVTVELPLWIEQIYSTEALWLRNAANEMAAEQIQQKCNHAFRYWANYFRVSRPLYVLVWGTSAPLSRLHLMLCRTMGIPHMVLERGHFLGTLLVDCVGHSFSSEKILRLADVCAAEPGDMTSILAWEKSVDEKVPYDNFNSDINKNFTQKLAEADKRIVLYIGANDSGSGCTRVAPDPEQCSFIINSTFDAVSVIHQSFADLFPECILVLKQHPADKNDYRVFSDDNTLLAEGMNINQLIKLADICVSTSTTAFAKCIVERKPIVTLAASDISLKNIAYECNELTSIPVMMRSALAGDGFEQKSRNGMAYLYELFDSSLVGVNDTIPTRLKIRDLTYMIYRRMVATTNLEVNPLHNCHYPQRVLDGREQLDVIVPVYRDLPTTRQCLDSLLAARATIPYRIVIVNDQSPEPELHELLRQYRDYDDVVLLENAVNLGFTGAVNRGVSLSSNRDVIVLNSDTIVSNDWADRLYLHAKRATNIGTVTPLSNNASIFSVRNFPIGFDLPEGFDIAAYDREIAATNAGATVEVPVGHGFCLFINRTCLDKVGFLDQVTFGKGYSEEVDFCLRARRYGFIHQCAADTFVAHVGGVSFQETGNAQRLKNRRVIEQKYPGYFAEIEAFIHSDPIADYRLP